MSAFSPSGSASGSSSSFPSSVTPTADSLSLSTASTEYTYTFPSGTKQLRVQIQGISTLSVRFVSGGPSWTIGAGAAWTEKDLLVGVTGLDVIFSSSQPSQLLEIIYWV